MPWLTWDVIIDAFFAYVVPILLVAFLAWFLDVTYRGILERRVMAAVRDFDKFAREHIRREVRRELNRRKAERDSADASDEYAIRTHNGRRW